MPRDPTSGLYSLPQGALLVVGTKFSSAAWNGFVSDIGNEITNTLDPRGETPMAASLNLGGNKITGVANGSASTDLINVGQLATIVGAPVGLIAFWPDTKPAPTNWIVCTNGGNASRTGWPALFALLGTGYGAGDGSTTFGLPHPHLHVAPGQDLIIRAA